MLRKFLIFLLATIGSYSIFAQTLDDALRYSLFEYNSTARFAGVSGAFTALGADLSIANINPAGIAEFRKSEITGTLNYFRTTNKAQLDGTSRSGGSNQINLGNIAAVFAYDPPSFNTRTFNLAIGMNQLVNFNETVRYNGTGPGTIVERFLEVAESNTPDELDAFEGGPAFDAGAIYNFDGGTTYDSDFVTLNEVVDRSEVIERSGTLNELFITVGSNIKNKFSWGATIGFPFANYREVKSYRESDPNDGIDIFNSLEYNQNLNTSGVGFNLKIGAIYKITPQLRFGAAFHTPSYFFLKDEFDTDVNYSFTADGTTENFSGLSPLSEFEYEFKSPWRVLGGLSYLYSAGDLKGFVSGEIEYVDYTSGSFNLTSNSNDPLDQFFQDELNGEIDDFFTSALNLRVGTEIAYKYWRARVGAALPSSPFNDSSALDFDPSLSIGIGYRGNKVYIDLAYTIRKSSTNYSPYRLINPDREPIVGISTDRSIGTLTFGTKL